MRPGKTQMIKITLLRIAKSWLYQLETNYASVTELNIQSNALYVKLCIFDLGYWLFPSLQNFHG